MGTAGILREVMRRWFGNIRMKGNGKVEGSQERCGPIKKWVDVIRGDMKEREGYYSER